jgi:hypothetical protein
MTSRARTVTSPTPPIPPSPRLRLQPIRTRRISAVSYSERVTGASTIDSHTIAPIMTKSSGQADSTAIVTIAVTSRTNTSPVCSRSQDSDNARSSPTATSHPIAPTRIEADILVDLLILVPARQTPWLPASLAPFAPEGWIHVDGSVQDCGGYFQERQGDRQGGHLRRNNSTSKVA